MYEKLAVPTDPGTEMKVTPESESLIMPKATAYQGAALFAKKYDWLSALREVYQAMSSKKPK